MNLPEALRRLADELDDVEPTLADDAARVEQRIAASLQTLHRQLVHDQLDTLYDLDTENVSAAEILQDLNRLCREIVQEPKGAFFVVGRRCVCSEEERSLSSVTMYPEGAVPWWFCEKCNGAYAPNHETLEVADG